MRLILAAGTTRTAAIDGISAAGAEPSLLAHTPGADAEILAYGRPVRAPVVPVSPSGCPTPAAATRAAREQLGFDLTVIDAGLSKPTAAPTVSVGAAPGGDVREPEPVPAAAAALESARRFGRALPHPEVAIAETIPGGTTTALGVLRALGEDASVSSSLPENPLGLKERVVERGLAASGLEVGEAAGEPARAIRRMGDPVLAVVAGFVSGAVETGTALTLAGGTQMVAVAALVRHGGEESPLALETTSYVAADPAVDLASAAAALDLDVTATDPGFSADHPAAAPYLDGEAKEGVGMGWAMTRAAEADALPAVRDRLATVYDRLVGAAEVADGS